MGLMQQTVPAQISVVLGTYNRLPFLKATIARYDVASDSAQISYEQVDTSLIAPRVRNYGGKSEKMAAASPQPAGRA